MIETRDRDLARQFDVHRDAAFAPRTPFAAVVGATTAPRRRRPARVAAALGVAVAALGAAVAIVVVREPRPHQRAVASATTAKPAAPAPAVRVVAADRAAAAGVPVDGATALELRVVREELALLGAPSPVAFVRFDDLASPDRSHPAPRREIVVRPVGAGDGGDANDWLAVRLTQVVLARLWTAGDRITWAGGGVNGGLVEAAALTGVKAPGVAALAALARRVTRPGVRLVHADVYPIGAVVARARLDEAAFLAQRFDPAMAALDPLDRATGAAVVSTIETPDGSVLGMLGQAWDSGGSGARTARAADAPPLRGPTRLDFTFQGTRADGSPRAPLRVHLDCETPAQSIGVTDPATACRTLVRRRYDLLTYAPFIHSCPFLIGMRSVAIRGTLGGHPVRRDDDPCYVGDAIERIAAVLGVPPAGWRPVSTGVLRAAIPPAWHAAALQGQAWLQLTTVAPRAGAPWDPAASLRAGDVLATVAPASGGAKPLPGVAPLSASNQIVGRDVPGGRTRYREQVDVGGGVVQIEVDVLAEPPDPDTLDTIGRVLQTIQAGAGFAPTLRAGSAPTVLR